jgi:flagellar M-ring protein FliF
VNRLTQITARARTMLAGFTIGQRAVVLVAVLALALGAFALSRWAAQPTWAPLFTNLSAENASAIVDQLRTDGVQYQLSNGGGTILVPLAQVDNLRVSLAGKGLTTTGGNDGGYSVLDKQGLTATDFQQNIAYQRALEGELSKTLKAISGVTTAIVHLAIPKKDVFTQETDKPTASVLLALAPGTTLGRAQIRSVMHLVAGSVPGLDPSDVTVSDADGHMLSVREDGKAGSVGAAGEADQQTQSFEDAKSAAVQKMLDQVLGRGRAVVRVNAELNFDSSHTTSKTYTTQTAPPLSEATSSESYAGNGGAGGVMGQTWPSLAPAGAGAGGGNYVKQERTVNNAVGEVVNETEAAPGSVKRLTVAVVMDATSAGGTDPARVQSLVAEAVGINPQRGDRVTVERLAFDTTAAEAAKKELAEAQRSTRNAQYLDLGKKAGLGLLLVIAAVVMMRRRREASPRVEVVASDLPPAPTMLPSSLEEQLAISAAAHEARTPDNDALDKSLERDLLRDEVSKFVDQQPEEIAAIVQGWLGQRKH